MTHLHFDTLSIGISVDARQDWAAIHSSTRHHSDMLRLTVAEMRQLAAALAAELANQEAA